MGEYSPYVLLHSAPNKHEPKNALISEAEDMLSQGCCRQMHEDNQEGYDLGIELFMISLLLLEKLFDHAL